MMISVASTYLAVFVVMGLALLGMSVGVIVAGKQIKGSCGGLSAITNDDGEKVCGICGQGVGSCEESELAR